MYKMDTVEMVCMYHKNAQNEHRYQAEITRQSIDADAGHAILPSMSSGPACADTIQRKMSQMLILKLSYEAWFNSIGTSYRTDSQFNSTLIYYAGYHIVNPFGTERTT
jgi:hypothetical protein